MKRSKRRKENNNIIEESATKKKKKTCQFLLLFGYVDDRNKVNSHMMGGIQYGCTVKNTVSLLFVHLSF
jgi:hypothetical protein